MKKILSPNFIMVSFIGIFSIGEGLYGQKFPWTQGHGDLSINFEGSEWNLSIEVDSESPRTFTPDDLAIQIGDNARLAVPASGFSFIGEAGSWVWISPQVLAPGIPHIGISTENILSGTFLNNRMDLKLSSFSGPGHFIAWSTSGTGVPSIRMSTRDGISSEDGVNLPAPGHTHMNWGFTKPGTYHVGFMGEGTVTESNSLHQSDEALFTFEVNVLKRGEIELELSYELGSLEIELLDEALGAVYEPQHAALWLGPNSWNQVGHDPNFAFLGVPEDSIYILPQLEKDGLLFPGFSGEGIPTGVFEQDTLQIELLEVDGPGVFSLYTVDGFGVPDIHFHSGNGISAEDQISLGSGAHAHFNWAFSTPGRYEVKLQISGRRTSDGNVVRSEAIPFYFEVVAPTFLDEGEVDLELLANNDGLEWALHNHGTEQELELSSAVLTLKADTRRVIPEDTSFHFLGAPGEITYVLPQEETEGILALGIASDEISTGIYRNDQVVLKLVDVDGPGSFALYSVNSFGVPSVYFNSRDGVTAMDGLPIMTGGHVHHNWSFSAPGVYRLSFRVEGTLQSNQQSSESEIFTLVFLVVEESLLKLTVTQVEAGNGLRIEWSGRMGRNYQLQSRAGLGLDAWKDSGPLIPGTGMTLSQDVPITDGTIELFRVVELLNP